MLWLICIKFVIRKILNNHLILDMFFGKLFKLLASPKVGWEEIGKYSIPNNLLLSKMFYPCLAILAISKFVPVMLGYIDMDLKNLIVYAMIDFVKFFVSFFILSLIATSLFKFTTENESETNKLNNYVVFNLTILVIIDFLKNLVPGFPVFDLVPLYIVFVAFCGKIYLNIPENVMKSFLTTMSILLIVVPIGVEYILNFMLPNV